VVDLGRSIRETCGGSHQRNEVEAKEKNMRIRPGILIAVAAVFVTLIGGRYLGWFGGKSADTTDNSEAPAVTPVDPAPETPKGPSVTATRPGQTGLPQASVPAPPAAIPTTPAATDATGKITDWEEKIDELLTTQEDETQKAKRLLAMFPNLPEDGQVEAAQHLSNLMPDEEYASLAHTLTNAAMPEAVLDVLMTDVLNRPNKIKLDTLFEVARTPNHAKAEEARDILEVFLDDVDWDAVKASGNWDTVRTEKDKWLKENPDEE